MYPMLKEGISIGTITYEDSDEVEYYVENSEGEEFEISYELYRALLRADGTRPLRLKNCGRNMIAELKEYGLIRTSRFVSDENVFNRFIIFPIGARAKKYRPLCRLVNMFLPMTSVWLFIIGVFLRWMVSIPYCFEFSIVSYYVLFFLSIIAHEFGHLIAGISAGYKFTDAGILLLGIFPIGAYVAHEDKKNAEMKDKLQMALSGIQANLLLVGIFLIGSVLFPTMYNILIVVANINVVLVCLNLLPAEGLDGESALSAILGVDSITKTAEEWIMNRKRRRKLLHSGVKGYISFCLMGISLLSKVFVGLLLIGNIMLMFFG